MKENAINHNFLEYYYREMNYLRDAGAIFAQDFPNIAGRLKIDGSETADPHVERLLESFAFLTARLQHNIDNIAADTTNALLDVLYPHLNKPLPSMSIAQFHVKEEGNVPPANGFHIKRHTEIFAYSSDDSICKFSTIYPLSLFPIILEKVSIVSQGAYQFVPVPNTLEFEYKKHNQNPIYFLELILRSKDVYFKELQLKDLCFYLNMNESLFKKQIYRALFSNPSLIYCARGEEQTAFPLLPHSLKPMGLERDEMALPPLKHEIHAYQLLQEFFHFFEKFMFFKTQKLDFLRYFRKGNFLQTHILKILIPLQDATSEWSRKIQKNDILINCTPIVNLHKVTTDPISWDRKQTFYHLSPHTQKDKTMEIYQIDDVFAIDTNNGQEKRICPYFSLEKNENNEEENLYWWSKYEETKHKNILGVDSWITFVDSRAKIIDPTPYVIYAKTLCTNRFLAEDIPQNTCLQIEMSLPADNIICLRKPIFPQYVLDKGTNNAKLIAQLSTNYLGFPYRNHNNIADNLRCILNMHMGPNNKEYGHVLLGHLQQVAIQNSIKRMGHESWRGFLEGVNIELILKHSNHLDDWFLLSQILHRYFAMNCQINTFVDLTLKEDHKTISKFENIIGEQSSI